jgi:phage FluMu protein gp41
MVELIETLESIRLQPPQWTSKTMRGLLVRGIQSISDIQKPLCKYAHCNLSQLARLYEAGREWVQALKVCNYDLELVYTESCVLWVELESLVCYGDLEEEDITASEALSDIDEMADGGEIGTEKKMNAGNKSKRRKEEDEEKGGNILFRDIHHAKFHKDRNYSTDKEENCVSSPKIIQGTFVNYGMTTTLEWLESHQRKFHVIPTYQIHESIDNFAALERFEIVPGDAFDSDMRSENIWNDVDGCYGDHNYSDRLENEETATAWMRDLDSSSNIGDNVTDG